MSIPSNSLASYRSYSYYHVLCMCDSTTTADALSRSNDLSVWDHATQYDRIEDLEDLGRYSPKCIGGSGKYIVLINGSTNATYVITQAKWSTATAAAAVPGDRGTSIAVEGSLQISEPKGIAFLDQIVKCSLALGVDSAQVVYVLKTFFVGHRDDAEFNAADAVISDIPPLNCIVYDVTGSFTEQGGNYEMNFVSVGHGASRLPQYSKLNDTVSLTAGSSLEATFTRLQETINTQYDEYFTSLKQQISNAPGVDAAAVARLLRPVKYVIEVGPEYKSQRYKVTDQPVQYKNSNGCDSPAQISIQSSSSIEAAINMIMQMSLEVKEDMAIGENGKRYEYKIHTAVVSQPVSAGSQCSTEQELDYTVYYRVERFLVPKSITKIDEFDVLQSDEADTKLNDPEYERLKNNIIQFDYLYTGSNTDILEFEMKVNHGLAFLQTASLSNTFKNQLERSAARASQPAKDDVNSFARRFGGESVQVPIFFGTSLNASIVQGSQNPSTAVDSTYTLTKHASIEMAEASMRIVGNDQLLRTTNRTTSAEFVTTSSKEIWQTTNASGSSENFKDWSRVPMFAKVNVKMPRNNDDFSLFTGQSPGTDGNQDYAQEFWFDGYYYIAGVEHVFEQGEFTQTLDMFALPKKSAFQSSKTQAEVETKAVPDNQIPCAPSAPSIPSTAGPGRGSVHPPFVRPNEDGTPTNKADATSSTFNRSLSDVPGWNNASPEVKNAITNAANRYQVNPVTLATVISRESNFNPTIKSPTSSATGLGQFIDKTWLGQVKKDPSIGVDPTAPKETQLAARTDPQTNANATASLLKDNARAVGSSEPGDIYLGHFAGPTVARTVVSSDNAGDGNKTLRQAYIEALGPTKGAAAFDQAKAANSTIISDRTTVSEFRAWAAKKMALGRSVPGTVTTTVTSTTKTRPARNAISAAIDCTAQDKKKDIQPCGDKQG